MVAAVGGATREISDLIRQFDGLKAGRIDFDRKWQMVGDYILTRRDFSVTNRPNQLRPHRVTSSVATNANTRLAAFLLAWMVDPTQPFLKPNVKRGLVAAGRETDLDQAGLDYLGALEWSIFDHIMVPKARFMPRLHSMLKEYCAFGCGVMWIGRRRGFGPYFNTRPLSACWWSENEEGVIDTLFFRMMLPVYRVLQRWPETAPALWPNMADKPIDEMALTPVVLACMPRPGGQAGAVREAKPFAYIAFSEEKKGVLERSGYDSFPYGVFRYDPLPGNAYAEGPGCQVMPDILVLNHLQQGIENSASQKAEPALAIPARMFGKTLDRRPGAVNAYNPSGIGLQRADQAIMKLDFTGDPTEAINLKRSLIDDIEMGFFVDWLRPRESGDQTATEVNDRRDIRLRGMASIVAHCEEPMTLVGDRAMEIMGEEGLLAPAPASVARAEADFEFAGPLSIVQLRSNAQSALQIINARQLVAAGDPAAAEAVDLEEALRVVAEGLGAPTRILKSRASVAAKRAAMALAQQQQQDAAKLAQVAQAGRDAGQGVAAVAGAAQDAQGGPGGSAPAGVGTPAPFAPASPFATPLAA